MQGIIWLWKHRHCWEQLRYLYSHRYELKRILAKVQIHPDSPEGVDNILARLREFDRIPLAMPRKTPPSVSGKVQPPYPWPKRDMPRPKQREKNA